MRIRRLRYSKRSVYQKILDFLDSPLSQTKHEPRFALITECASPQQYVVVIENTVSLLESAHRLSSVDDQPETILKDDAKLQDIESEEETRQDDDLFQLRALCDSLEKE
ncbi:unnamed protein product [Clavelina lepadiformis]|uniref:Uncharacterized protein n=1 Tax=Clavelina lepadiformis TaxID=159417 RepID=A0ABP0F054_CLALP